MAIFKRVFTVTIVAGLATVMLAAKGMAVTVGKQAPDFTLRSTAGHDIRLSQFRGKTMVLLQFYAINFGST